MGCNSGIQTMIDEQRRLYRLLDSVMNGTQYTTTPPDGWGGIGGSAGGSWGDGGIAEGSWGSGDTADGSWGATEDATYTLNPDPDAAEQYIPIFPPLPLVPTEPAIAPGLRARFERLLSVQDNQATGRLAPIDPNNPDDPALEDDQGIRATLRAMQGIINAGWFGIGGENATLADIVETLRIGNAQTATDLGDEIKSLLDGISDATIIADWLKNQLVGNAADLAEGGAIAVQLAATAANLATMNNLATQVERLVKSIDGGAAIRPGDNILLALRGTTEASAARNVIDAAQDAVLANKLDTLIAEVTKINTGDADLGDMLAKLEEIRSLLV